MTVTTCQFFEYHLTTGDPKDILIRALETDGPTVINTINAHAFNVSLKDTKFHDALSTSDVLVADGIGVVWAAKLLGARPLRKISGFDLFSAAMEIADDRRMTVGFLGSTDEVLEKIAAKAADDYPNIVLRTFSPPFASSFTDTEATRLVDEIGTVDILCVGMTAPKQEKFATQIKNTSDARAILSIGAVFDFYAGTIKRAHPLLIKMGLEWLGRSFADPKRLGKRNLIAIPTFVYNCLKLAISNKQS